MSEKNNRLFRDPEQAYAGYALSVKELKRTGQWDATVLEEMDSKFQAAIRLRLHRAQRAPPQRRAPATEREPRPATAEARRPRRPHIAQEEAASSSAQPDYDWVHFAVYAHDPLIFWTTT
jgi:hypothetical protein